MSLWNLLIFLNVITPPISTLYCGAKVGNGVGSLIGIVVGLLMGLCNFYGLRAMGKSVWHWTVCCKEQQRLVNWVEPALRILYIGVFLWIFVSGLLGDVITQWLIKMGR